MTDHAIPATGDSTLNTLPPRGMPRFLTLAKRALLRRCPLCGGKHIFKNYLSIKDSCPTCKYVFARESGYFLGSYPLNLVTAELIPVLAMVGLLVWTDVSWIWLEVILIPLAIAMPLLFFPFAMCIWMAIDLFFQPVNQR